MAQKMRILDPERRVLEIIGHHHLEEVSDNETSKRGLPWNVLKLLRLDLWIKLMRLCDWTRDQIGKKGFKQRRISEVLHKVAGHNAQRGIRFLFAARGMAAKNFHHQTDSLKREK